ncbi:hypothetical protein WR25_16652 [Diploscapter pachys]|uniref:Uncharacterized protein n=1 Tax=Diploscapter pachys TaxID=2018661 RepID=A0A2A2KDE9_9BILA|nr:hypothetical protein WR25_16652 [Diploscapter pachys]
MDQTVIQDPVHRDEQGEDQLESLRTSWINPEHPERRPGRFATEDDQTEFVRTDYSQTVYKKVRTYNLRLFHRKHPLCGELSLSVLNCYP